MFTKTIKLNFKPSRMPNLGTRELDVLDILWQCAPLDMSANDVLAEIHQNDDRLSEALSINTVQSTLERLVKKQLLVRTRQGRAYFYKTKMPKQQIIASLIRDIAEDMSQGDMQVMISGFMDFVGSEDPELSNKLERALGDVGHSKPEKKSD